MISIIIPVYNHEAFVEQAIKSACSQTCSDLEIIIIDDASSDSSASISARVAERDERCIFFRNEVNLGAARTINKGLRMARGDFVAILNSDDIFEPERMEVLRDIAEKERLDFIITDIVLINRAGDVIKDKSHWWIQWYEALKAHYVLTGDPVATILGGNFAITTSNFFLRRTILKQLGYFNDYRYVSDYDFLLRFLAERRNGFKFLHQSALLRYRLHGENTILERPLEANRETFALLTNWLPELLCGKDRTRAARACNYLKTIEHYIELELGKGFENDLKALAEQRENDLKALVEQREENRSLSSRNAELLQENERLKQESSRLHLEITEHLAKNQSLNIEIERTVGELRRLNDDVNRLTLETARLSGEVDRLGHDIVRLEGENARLNEENQRLRDELQRKQEERNGLLGRLVELEKREEELQTTIRDLSLRHERELNELMGSRALKIGRFITGPFSYIKRKFTL